MNEILNELSKIKNNNPDLIVNKIHNKYIVYLQTTISIDKVEEYILKPYNKIYGKNIKLTDLFYYLVNGYTAIINKSNIKVIETKADIYRSITIPDAEPSLTGPKDSFTENIETNIGLIKRRVKDYDLNFKNYIIGKRTKTTVSVLSINGLCQKNLLHQLENKIKHIDVDSIIDSSELSLLLEKDNTSFPTIIKTERPDTVSKSLLEGKIAIIVDNSCYALIMPSFLIDFINPKVDDYSKSKNINFVKILRMICFIVSIIAPGLYIALINYNPESIPTTLMINFSMQRSTVPFPAFFEAFIMIIMCEILRESDLRFPNSYGSTISILGALIIGDAAVSAGIVSPIMIIVIAITFITSLTFTEYELINALRRYRFLFLIMASFFGIIGVVISGLLLISNLASIYNYNNSYMYPISPYEKNYFKKEVIRSN